MDTSDGERGHGIAGSNRENAPASNGSRLIRTADPDRRVSSALGWTGQVLLRAALTNLGGDGETPMSRGRFAGDGVDGPVRRRARVPRGAPAPVGMRRLGVCSHGFLVIASVAHRWKLRASGCSFATMNVSRLSLGSGAVETMLDAPWLTAVLEKHIAHGAHTSADLRDGQLQTWGAGSLGDPRHRRCGVAAVR